jgi:pimeloyl-ACP methyl ester carboxylesterase
MCKKCFNENVALDMDLKVESIGMIKGTAPCLVFVHGGGGNRMMFAAHARLLASNFCCVLLDLPGHGSKMDDPLGPLTINTAIETIVRVVDDHTCPFKGVKPIFIGGSLGAYIGMELLGRHPTCFSSAVLMMAGQNTGVGRSWKAYLGLVAFKIFIPILSTETLMKFVLKAAKSNGYMSSEMIQELALRTGMYFKQGPEQVDILANSDPLATLPRFDGRVLFINGSLDHRDSEQKWVEACKHGK